MPNPVYTTKAYQYVDPRGGLVVRLDGEPFTIVSGLSEDEATLIPEWVGRHREELRVRSRAEAEEKVHPGGCFTTDVGAHVRRDCDGDGHYMCVHCHRHDRPAGEL